MTHTAPFDAPKRAEALDLTQSFIVQAPAGSGKTELLTQRFLKLLARVDRPERILAITFTRKATAEMRERILRRLRQAAAEELPSSEHERVAIDLAREALQRDQQQGWKLLQNPGRLRVLTIDGLCAQFLARDAKLGGLGAGLAVQELAEPLYREAIECLFEDLASVPEDSKSWSNVRQALSRVLYLLDGDAQNLRELLVDKLQARDQWVDRIGMEANSLAAVIAERQAIELNHFYQALGRDRYHSAANLMANLGNEVCGDCPPSHFAGIYQADTESLHQQVHQAFLFCRVLLKKDLKLMASSSLNKRVFKNLPKPFDTALKALQNQLAEWSDEASASAAIERMGKAPPLELGEDTERLQQDIVLVLKHALARLRVHFHDKGECDFHYMTELALESLGDEDNPGSLLLAEDARIEHILMDEFQDTSNTQFKLLRRLMSGWTGDDGRSLFLVGDPMQSIYRFRQANVGLFIDVVQQKGLGTVPLEYLRLQSNFRSRQEIVEWVNQQFTGIFPAKDERDSGAVQYARAAAEQGTGGSVHLYALPPKTPDEEEAQRVVALIRQARAELGDPTIGILASARKHLEQIARALQQAGIEAQAVKIDQLQERPVVRDLIALTRALSHPGDRIAWLAVLRAPWAGLTVAELHAVTGALLNRDLLTCLQEASENTTAPELRERLQRIAHVMTDAILQRGDDSLRRRVETAWLGLGGPLCYASVAELEHARTFLDLLQELEQESSENLETRLSRHLQELYADSSASRLQLMTIHQAKGLEFDVVIVPGMARKPRGDAKTLVALQEFRNENGEDSSLLAPLPARIKPEASLYAYLNAVEIERSAFEQQRVLYVASTRARTQLHLLGKYNLNKEGECAPSGSLMELLFPAFKKAIVGGSLEQNPSRPRPLLQENKASGVGASHARDDAANDPESNNDTDNEYTLPQAYPLLQLQGAPLLPLNCLGSTFTVGASHARDKHKQNDGEAKSHDVGGRSRADRSRASMHSAICEHPGSNALRGTGASLHNASLARDPAQPPLALPELPTRKSVAIGGAVHEWLELIHDHWEQGWNADWFEQHKEALQSSLARAGLSQAEATEHLPELQKILTDAISTETGRAVLNPKDKQKSWTELPLLRRDGNRISKHIIDRMYEDETGLTIVDYKTGTESPETRERWANQLQRYRDLVQRLEAGVVTDTLIFQATDNQVVDLSRETIIT